MLNFLAAFLLTGCVIRYGKAPEPMFPGENRQLEAVDFTAVDARILLAMQDDTDRDRELLLESTRDLIRQARLWPHEAQDDLLAYLLVLLDVEERAPRDDNLRVGDVAVTSAEVGVDGDQIVIPRVEEVQIDLPESLFTRASKTPSMPTVAPTPVTPVPAVAPSTPLAGSPTDGVATSLPDAPVAAIETAPEPVRGDPVTSRKKLATEILEAARISLEEGRFKDAIDLLESLGNPRVGPNAGLWQEAVDAYVMQQRDRAGQMFMQARGMPTGEEKKDLLRDVQKMLSETLKKYPESTYAGALARNRILVERELQRQ